MVQLWVKCFTCGKSTDGEFLTINGGILPSEDESSFLSICSHHDDYPSGLKLVSELGSYQYEFYFCNPSCIRKFFNRIVDDLEAQNEI